MHRMDTDRSQGLEEVVRVRLSRDARRKLRAHARADERTESSQIRLLIHQFIENREAA